MRPGSLDFFSGISSSLMDFRVGFDSIFLASRAKPERTLSGPLFELWTSSHGTGTRSFSTRCPSHDAARENLFSSASDSRQRSRELYAIGVL